MAFLLTFFFVVLLPLRGTSSERKPEDFTCKILQPGFHILGKVDCGLKIWKDAHRGEPLFLNYTNGTGCAYRGFTGNVQLDIMKAVGMKKREKYQLPAAFFTPQGVRLTAAGSLTDFLNNGGAIFMMEGGQFQWPPVEVGFRTVVEGIKVSGKPVELETLAVSPPLFKVHNLASKEEVTAVIEHAKPKMENSTVISMDDDKAPGTDRHKSKIRDSRTYRPWHNETPVIARMEKRAAKATRMPFSHLETVQVLYYQKGGYYHAHDDAGQLQWYISDREELQGRHYGYFDRLLTLFWYMNDVPKGGETNFPMAGGSDGANLDFPSSLTNCTQGIMVKPVAGQAILWYNLYPHGLVTPYALHASCDVEEGEKYAVNVWIHSKPFDTPPVKWDPDHPRLKRLEILAGKKAGTKQRLESKRVTFVNKVGATIQMHWYGHIALDKVEDPIPPGKEMTLTGVVGHHFVAKRGDSAVGSCIVVAGGGKTQKCVFGAQEEL